LQKKLKLGLRKGKQKINLGWHKDRKEDPINAPSIHIGALVLVHSGHVKIIFVQHFSQFWPK
jgi:hypothetical protein